MDVACGRPAVASAANVRRAVGDRTRGIPDPRLRRLGRFGDFLSKLGSDVEGVYLVQVFINLAKARFSTGFGMRRGPQTSSSVGRSRGEDTPCDQTWAGSESGHIRRS